MSLLLSDSTVNMIYLHRLTWQREREGVKVIWFIG